MLLPTTLGLLLAAPTQSAPRADGAAACPRPSLNSLGYATFIREHESALHAAALRLCGNVTDTRDLIQDTMERALRNLAHYTPGTDGRAWLLTILRHLFIDRCRALIRERREEISTAQVERIAAPEAREPAWWESISPEQLREAVERIPEEFRLVYRLHALEGRSYTEISERLCIPKATVGTRLVRARRHLKKLFTQEADRGGA